MSKLDFYTNPMSRGRIARWMLEELGAPYETHVLSYGAEMQTPDFLALNPLGKVPVIVHDGHVVSECAAICAYLATTFPDAGLGPNQTERADFFRWLFFAAGPVEAAVLNHSFGFTIPDGSEARARSGYGNSLDGVADMLATLFADGRDYVTGSRFTAADVYVGAQITWGLQFGTLPERPGFADYAARLAARPAAVRAKEMDDALMPQS